MSQQTPDHTSVFIPHVGVSEVVEQVAADDIFNGATTPIAEGAVIELTSVANSGLTILVNPANSDPEVGNDGDSSVNTDVEGENVSTHETVIQVIARTIKAVGAFTMAVIVHMAYSEPASGHEKLAYIAALAVIFFLGVGEYITGLWISMSGSIPYRRRLWIAGIVLFLSISLLVGIHMGGFA